ncbi:MAG TPA: GNAT family N-acetyltransferase [Burkholderiales bacterium]|nr:GNAT family N-acetyltransferase [Burkholderiales bacterium]
MSPRELERWREDWMLADGARVACRPIRPDDAALEQEFVRGLSPESRHNRFMAEIRELSPEMLARFTRIRYPHDLALIVTASEGGREREIAVARYVALAAPRQCEFALAVADGWQGRGVGYRLMQTLIGFAREAGFGRMEGYVLAANHKMLELMHALGFDIRPSEEGPQVRLATRALQVESGA